MGRRKPKERTLKTTGQVDTDWHGVNTPPLNNSTKYIVCYVIVIAMEHS